MQPALMPPCALPSATSACDLVYGVPGATTRVVMHTAGRALLIAVGIWASGERNTGRVVRHSVGAALAIEAFALCWAAYRKSTNPDASAPTP